MKWLFIAAECPWPIIHGRWLRVYHLARTLAARGERVDVHCCLPTAEGIEAYGKVGVGMVVGIGRKHVDRGRALHRFSMFAHDEDFGLSIARQTPGYDVVVLCGSRVLQYAEQVDRTCKILFDMVDDSFLEFARRKQTGRTGLRERLRLFKNRLGKVNLERDALRFVDYTSFVSREDCTSFNARHPRHHTLLVPNGVDVGFFAPPADVPPVAAEGPTVVFTGHMSNPNNELAATWLVQEIAPLIWKGRPDVLIQLVGAEPSAALRALASERVAVTGRVEDIRPYLWNAGVILLSMKSGTGIKNKLLEAWAANAPVVATPLACQGVPAENGANLLLGNSPEELARATCELLANRGKRQALADRGRETVVRELTWGAAAARLNAAFGG
ncbi:glycosyltransferase family 4 protein [Geoalkalibacter sp.]|uniref:glycosyltransferase family 4 protein n=1 Tax=Geoalkalibacter sp. TaxID=3041440 RepID=UPI00272E2A27|nr:glycosyltransferase family 4 protein [Geoalkalibacter sp.]